MILRKRNAGLITIAAVVVAASVVGIYALTSSSIPVNPSTLTIPSGTVINVTGTLSINPNDNSTTQFIMEFNATPGDVVVGAWSANAPIQILALPGEGVYFLPSMPDNWSMNGTLSIHLWDYIGNNSVLPYRLTFFAPLGTTIRVTQTI